MVLNLVISRFRYGAVGQLHNANNLLCFDEMFVPDLFSIERAAVSIRIAPGERRGFLVGDGIVVVYMLSHLAEKVNAQLVFGSRPVEAGAFPLLHIFRHVPCLARMGHIIAPILLKIVGSIPSAYQQVLVHHHGSFFGLACSKCQRSHQEQGQQSECLIMLHRPQHIHHDKCGPRRRNLVRSLQ